MSGRATIGDVAAAAGVSTATVSRVLNGGPVTEATASRVWAAAERLAYSPNALTRSVFAGRSDTIGVVIRDLASPFYLDMIRGVDEVASANGSLVLFANTFRRIDREIAQVRAMDEQRVRGLIVTTGDTTDDRTRRMAENGTPCVVVARTLATRTARMHSVSLDDAEAGRLIATHLAECGRSAIGVVTGSRRPTQLARVHGLGDGAVAIAESEADVDSAVDALLRTTPDAIVCLTGRLAVAAYSALTARGIDIPRDVAFLTMDEFPWAAALDITVVAQPAYAMGTRAAELIVANPDEPGRFVFEPTLIARGSCGER